MMNSTEPGTSSPSARRSFSEGVARRLGALALGLVLALAPASYLRGATERAPSPEPGGPALLALRGDASGMEFLLVCSGRVSHRLEQGPDGTTLTVDLPGVANTLEPDSLPAPSGPVKAISVGTGPEGARITFALYERAAAMVQPTGEGVRLRLIPASGGEGRDLAGAARPLGTEDLLEISVFEVPDLNRTVRVSETGTISLPLIGEIPAAGLTPRQLEIEIRGLLDGSYVKDPQVSVFVQEHGSKKVSVLGSVGKPGVYEMLGPRTLLQVLAQAGGLTDEVGTEIFVIRASPGGGHQRIPVDVQKLVTSEDPSLNLALEPGDVVSAPRDPMIHIFVDGAVKSPGRIEQKASRGITLMQAIAKAGGATERANLKKVQILRKGAGSAQTSIVFSLHAIRKGEEPDPVLRDGDVVVIPETFF